MVCEMGGRTVGLVGYGAVPKILAPILTAIGAEVRYWSRTQRSTELETLVATSDVVSLHLPLTPETKGPFDVRKMKPGAILVNTSRGGLPPAGHALLSLPNVI